MTDELTIQPALTSEQWREAISVPPGIAWGFGQATEGTASCHAIAALCLYGQSFGFTQEDVRRLRDAPDLYGGLQGSTLEREWWAFLESLAGRIAALLPPTAP